MKKIKIGLDVHGTITAYPTFWSILTNILINNGDEVHIMTGARITPEFLTRLNSYNVKWTHLFSITDHHIKIGSNVDLSDPNNPVLDPKLWDPTKAEYALENKLDVVFDDTLDYAQYFKTPFFYLKTY